MTFRALEATVDVLRRIYLILELHFMFFIAQGLLNVQSLGDFPLSEKLVQQAYCLRSFLPVVTHKLKHDLFIPNYDHLGKIINLPFLINLFGDCAPDVNMIMNWFGEFVVVNKSQQGFFRKKLLRTGENYYRGV